jgi:formate dehydrogenase subunit gamma
VQAVTFLALLVTGFMLGISQLEELVGDRALVREIHLATAFFFVFGPALVALAGDRVRVREDMREVDEWTKDDIRWLARPTVDPDDYSPPAGKFNAGQKFNAIFTVYSTLAFGVTGLILWQNRRFPFDVVSQANTIHNDLAYIALAVFLGHLYLAVGHPATRHSLRGMLLGTVREDWARHHHGGWVVGTNPEAPLHPGSLARSIVLLALGVESALLLVRFGFEWLGANTTDQITKQFYRFSGLPGTSTHAATATHVFDLGALIWFGLIVAVWLGVSRGQAFLPRTLSVPSKA